MRKTPVRRCLAALLTLALLLSLAPAVFAAGLTLNQTRLSLNIGQTANLTATTGTVSSWSSSNIAVATVTNGGAVTAVGSGTATITASDTAGDSATCTVTVADEQVTDITVTLKETAKTLTYGQTAYLEVEKVEATWNIYDNGTVRKTDITSSSRLSCSATGGAGIVTIQNPSDSSSSGLRTIPIRAVRQGSDTVKVKVDYKNRFTNTVVSNTADCTVTVGYDTKVIIEDYTAVDEYVNMTKGTPKTLKAYVTVNGRRQSETENQKITWSKTDSGNKISLPASATGSSITVTPAETATAADHVTITATYNGFSKTVTCIIKAPAGGGTDPDPDDPDKPPTGDTLPTGVTPNITVNSPADGRIMEPGTEQVNLSVSFTPAGGTAVSGAPFQTSQNGYLIATYIDATNNKRYEVPITWSSDAPDVAKVEVRGSQYYISASSPGEATLTFTVSGASDSVKVEVSGFKLLKKSVTIEENKSLDPFTEGIIKAYGNARSSELSIWSDAANIASFVNGSIAAYSPGTTTFTVSDARRGFRDSFQVTVEADHNSTLPTSGSITIKTTETLPFTDRRLTFSAQAGGSLSHITGINVDASKGAVYYNYRSESQPGKGVGAENYYYPGRNGGVPAGQRSLEALTFVPNRTFPGGEVNIYYTAVSTGGQTYSCQIILTVTPEGGAESAISMETAYNTPLKFTGAEFNRVCQDRLGSKLNYVVFSQPPERQGKLYTNYINAGNYGSVVETNKRYTLKDLDNVWFVPAPGYSGPVTVYYTAYGTGTSGSYPGQVTITVGRESGVSTGGLAYDISKGGVARFDDADFNRYCQEVLYESVPSDRQILSFIRFESMPGESEGVLYYDYRSSTNTGSRVVEGTTYYYGTRSPRIDRLTFVPAKDFTGTVRIPFTGQTVDGTRFSGNVEINVRSGIGSGDIYYTCAPGRSVSFRTSDFTGLSRDLTGNTLDYIQFQGLPNSKDGSLYHNNTRISATGTRYYNSSGASRISNLSFRASSSFSGTVDIPFIGTDRRGNTFNAVVTISDSSSGNSGSSSRGDIRYTTDYNTAVVFDRDDFDDLSQWETDRNVSSVRFTPPLSSEGSLYRNYRSSSNMGTRITSNTTVNASELDRVAFVPASGFSGTAYIDFTANASGSGGSFTGSVEVVVGRDYSSGYSSAYFSDMNGYSAAQQRAVDFLYDRGITRGLTTGQYGPESHIRRGDFARMVYIAFGMTPSANTSAFQDVPAGIYYAEAVNALAARGVVSGTGGGLFSPDSALTRQDAVCMVQRAMRAVGREAGDGSTGALSGYSDWINISGYAQGAMSFAVQRGYLPTAGGRLSPTQPLTRVDMAEIIYRVLTY